MEIGEASISSRPSSSLASLEDCMKLLRGENDSQRLACLLLVTKFCDKDNQQTVHKVYNAVSPSPQLPPLPLGSCSPDGEGGGGGDNANMEAYLQLAVMMLAAFARVAKIAASEEMVSKVPLFLEVMSNMLVSFDGGILKGVIL